MANFCSRCGSRLDDNASFCSNCGYSIKKEENINTSTDTYTNNDYTDNSNDNTTTYTADTTENKSTDEVIGESNTESYNIGTTQTQPTTAADPFPKVGLILGILGIIFAWFFALAGHILSILGIILGAIEYKKTHKPAGLIVSIIGETCAIISSVLGFFIALATVSTMSGLYF